MPSARASAPGPRVRTVVSMPARAVYRAADTPAGPEPMITTFAIALSSRVALFCLSYSISHFGAGFRDRLTKLRLGPGQQLPDRRGVAGVGPGRQHFVQEIGTASCRERE